MGGLIALATALRAPAKVTRLVVASSAARLTAHGRRVLELFHDLLLYAPPDRAGAALMTLAFSPPFHQQFSGFVTEVSALYGIDEADLPGTLAQLEHLLVGWDMRKALATVEKPALVLCGDRDPLVAVEDTVELADALPDARLIRLPSAAHSVLAEGGDKVLDRLVSFLS
jgi:pimeloyl-ACP methyl ester carboxylesterase